MNRHRRACCGGTPLTRPFPSRSFAIQNAKGPASFCQLGLSGSVDCSTTGVSRWPATPFPRRSRTAWRGSHRQWPGRNSPSGSLGASRDAAGQSRGWRNGITHVSGPPWWHVAIQGARGHPNSSAMLATLRLVSGHSSRARASLAPRSALGGGLRRVIPARALPSRSRAANSAPAAARTAGRSADPQTPNLQAALEGST